VFGGEPGTWGASNTENPGYPWAYEMRIEDPDEHVLRFGSDSKASEPFGEWRDMRGDNWVMSPDGSWTRVEQTPSMSGRRE